MAPWTSSGAKCLRGVSCKAIGSADLAKDRSGNASAIEGADGLKRVRALIGHVHARTGVDEAHVADAPVMHQLLQHQTPRVKLKLMVDGDLDRARARKVTGWR